MNSSEWRKKSFTWGKRVTLVVLILGGLMYGVLGLAERSKDALRQGFEAQLAKATGQKAEITEMISADLVPNVAFRMKGIYLRDAANIDNTLLKIDQAYISTSIWSMVIGVGNYYGFEFKGVEIASGFWFPKKISLKFFGVSDPAPETAPATFLIDGTYNDLPLLMTAELERKIKSRGPFYSLSDDFPVTFKLGPSEGTATYKRGFLDAGLYDGLMTRDGHELRFKIELAERNPLKINGKGALDGVRFNAELTKSGEDKLLKISSESQKDSDLANLKKFIGSLSKDLGFSDKDLTITYDALLPAEPKAEDKKEE